MADTSAVQSLIVSTAQKYGLDPAFALAVANQESGFNQAATSSAGAIGVFQLMPATAAGLGVNPNDATQNIDGGIRYLSQMLSKYGGDQTLALAAYNAGPGNVAKYGGVPPFSETQNYISSILSSISNFAAGLFGSSSDSSSPYVADVAPFDGSADSISGSDADSVSGVFSFPSDISAADVSGGNFTTPLLVLGGAALAILLFRN